jgi:hypothetical protein
MHLCPNNLSEEDKADINAIKLLGNNLYGFLDGLGECREISLAKTKLEESVMWAVKGITKARM